MVFLREDILAKLLFTGRAALEAIFVELFLHKNIRLLCCAYNTNKNSISNELGLLRKSFDLLSAYSEIILKLGDFNLEFDRTWMNAFCDSYSLKSFAKKTYFF